MIGRLLSIFFVLSFGFSHAQVGRGILAIPDTQVIVIGDQINLELILKSEAADRITFPTVADTLSKEIEVVSVQKPDTSFDPNNINQRIISQKMKLTAWDSGFFQIPSFVGIINGDSAFSQAIPIKVFTMPIDSTNAITDIKPNIDANLTIWDYLEVYGIYVFGWWAVLVALFLIWWFFLRKKKTQKLEIKPEVRIPPHVLAFERLLQLEEKQLWQKGKHKEYHVRLSEILREYLENRYKILAMEQTTDEILGDLRPLGVDEETRKMLREVLMLMDLVKFAKQQPLASENEGAMKAVRSIIVRTKILEEREQAENTDG